MQLCYTIQNLLKPQDPSYESGIAWFGEFFFTIKLAAKASDVLSLLNSFFLFIIDRSVLSVFTLFNMGDSLTLLAQTTAKVDLFIFFTFRERKKSVAA